MYFIDTFQEARLKLPQATLMSDLQTDDDDDDRPAYTRRKNRGNKRNHSTLLTEVFKAQEVIKQQLVMVLKNQQKQNSAQSQSDEFPDISSFNLPLSDLSDLERLENQIKDQPEHMKKLVTYFGIIGGFSTKEAVWRILGKLLVNSLAKKINWSGANQKVAFRALALRTVVVNAVRANAHTKMSTDKEVEKYITRWLQLAPDRDGGRKERAKSKSNF
ncbi:uncharacterized protein [Paramisgurnus dabryanus]|uniref:uncharacterized protein n=1 Tax=Paramisgurnus dabryanus TaxID=90735 RepID=UPI0031F34735